MSALDSSQSPSKNRIARRPRTPYSWLSASALGVGTWAALALGSGVAHAEDQVADSTSTSSSSHAGRASSTGSIRPVAQRNSVAAASWTAGKTTASAVVSGARPAAAVRTAGQNASIARVTGAAVASPGVSETWQPGSVLRAFVGDGTADNPNAGLLVGNGFSYDATTCPTSCNGGSGGILGNGGDGYNGGNGGSAGWFGRGGVGGDAITAANGGNGGSGGLFVGDGGAAGSGAPAPYGAADAGGSGGSGGTGGLLFGNGGAGGVGGNGITTGGGSGGAGGDGGFIVSQGGRGGAGGSGTTGGTGGAAGVGRTLLFVQTAADPGTLGSTNVVISDQYGSTTIDGKYVVMNNNYSGIGSQTITVTSTGFAITNRTGSASTSGAPLSYPAVYLGCHYANCSPSSPLPIQISTITSATSSINYTYPSDPSFLYDASYDIWMDPTPKTTGVNQQELMIWFNKQGSAVQPISYTYDAQGAAVPITTTTIDGVSWNVYRGTNGANNVVSYVAVTTITALTDFNVLSFIEDVYTRTANPPPPDQTDYAYQVTNQWYLTSIQAGFEPWLGGDGLTVDSFDATVS